MNPLNLMIIALVHRFPSDTLYVPHVLTEDCAERSWERTIRERLEAGCTIVPLKLDENEALYIH